MKRLGKGLLDLIPVEETGDEEGISVVSLKRIYPSALQPRQRFDDKAIRQLADSIRRHGLAQPIMVRKTDKGYEIIAGERRFRACLIARLVEVPVYIRQVSDQEALELAVVENIDRKKLTVMELACAYKELMKRFSLKQDEVAAMFGKTRVAISNQMRLLQLPESIQELVIRGQLKEGHARALLPLADISKQEEMASKILKDTLSVREVESFVKAMLSRTKKEASESISLQDVAEKVSKKAQVSIALEGGESEGALVMRYSSAKEYRALKHVLEELNYVLEKKV